MIIYKLKNKKNLVCILICFILLFSEYFFFRNIIGSNKLIGDRGDGRLTMLITEHWFNFFKGKEKFGELVIFYPAANVLAYSDMLFFYGIIHSLFRFIGIDIFNAYKYTIISIHFIGTLSMYYLLFHKLKLNIIWSLFGVIAFSFSSTYATHLAHTQLCACSMLPMLLIFLINFFENLNKRKKRNVYAFLTITWYLLILYNSWYIAFFTVVFILIFTIICIIGLLMQKKNILKILYDFIIKVNTDIIIYVVYITILLIPFVKLYFPLLKKGGYDFSNIKSIYIPKSIALINIGEDNWLLGNFMRYLQSLQKPTSEWNMGFSLILLSTFIIFSIFYTNKKRKTTYEYIISYLMIAVLVGMLFSIKVSSKKISLWYFIYKLIPGASSVRAVSRYLLYLSFPMAILSSIGGNFLFNTYNFKNTNYKKYIPICLFIFLWISNIRNEGVYSTWNSSFEKEYLSGVSKPDIQCKVFYMSNTNSEVPQYIYQLDAFEIANKFELKTINGYSGNIPDSWEDIWEVSNENYENGVSNWIILNNLKNVCRYDVANNKWFIYNKTGF